MTTSEQLKITEANVLKSLGGSEGYDSERLFWMRYHMGCIYLNNYYPLHKNRLINSRLFWQWYRGIWHLNDLWMLKYNGKDYHMKYYKLYQKKRFEQYRPTRLLMQEALRETEEITT